MQNITIATRLNIMVAMISVINTHICIMLTQMQLHNYCSLAIASY